MGMGPVFSTLFKLALFVGAIGLLPTATAWLENEALQSALSHPVSGFVSYRAIQRGLLGRRAKSKSSHSPTRLHLSKESRDERASRKSLSST